MKTRHSTKNKEKPKNHPTKQKIHPTKNFRAIWVIGLIIFITGIALDNIWIIVPGGILAIYGIMNRHSWHIAHLK